MTKPPDDDKRTVSFVQHNLPPLEAGEYTLTVQQALTGTNLPPGLSLPTLTHKFAVYGERFKLDPQHIVKVFPPDQSQGEYSRVLPHVVLSRHTLPWERTLDDSPVKLGTPKDGETDPRQEDDFKDVAPWLAVIVLDQDDFAAHPKLWPCEAKSVLQDDKPKSGTPVTVQDLVPEATPVPVKDKDTPGRLPPRTFSYFEKTKWDDILEYGETFGERCQVVDLPIDVFDRIAPTEEDLPWLAHTRTLSWPRAAPGVGAEGGNDYAMIVANRRPHPGGESIAHLVSLENLGPYLPDKDGKRSAALGQEYDTIRLVSLKSWRFRADPEAAHSFAWYLEHLNGPDGKTAESLLRLSSGGTTNETVQRALDLGYVPLEHRTRTGDRTVSWYRGPFVPCLPASGPDASAPELPAHSPDALNHYDPTTGLLDVSYAAAWQIGRLLALGNRQFAVDLYHWKTEQVHRTIVNAKAHGADYHAAIKQIADGASERGGQAFAAGVKTLQSWWDGAPQLPDTIAAWLRRLLLLHGVPFNYLVAHERMLPAESLRTFVVDWNWIAALLDGALSIGRVTQSSWAHDLAFTGAFFDQVKEKVAELAKGPLTQLSGLLVRSAVVEGWWPGILIDGYSSSYECLDPESKQQIVHFEGKLPIVRYEALSPSVLLCLFGGADVVRGCKIHEPPEGLHFGFGDPKSFDEQPAPSGEIAKILKYVHRPDGSDGESPGSQIPEGEHSFFALSEAEIPQRGDTRVLQAAQLADKMRDTMQQKGYLAAGDPFTAAEFALEMTEGVQMVQFLVEGKTKDGGRGTEV